MRRFDHGWPVPLSKGNQQEDCREVKGHLIPVYFLCRRLEQSYPQTLCPLSTHYLFSLKTTTTTTTSEDTFTCPTAFKRYWKLFIWYGDILAAGFRRTRGEETMKKKKKADLEQQIKTTAVIIIFKLGRKCKEPRTLSFQPLQKMWSKQYFTWLHK